MEKRNEIDVTLQLQEEKAMNEILKDTIKQNGETMKGLRRIILGLIAGWFVSICFGFGAFVWYESQFVTLDGEGVEISTEGENANAEYNDVDGNQYNDNATHTESDK